MSAVLSFLNLPGLSARESAEPGFLATLAGVAEKLGLDPSYIAAVMSLESGVDPQAVNPKGGATGLIQFMPQTAAALGTSVEALRGMNATQQLEFVERYFHTAGRAIRRDTPGDYYMATFLPAYVGKSSDTVLAVRGESVYDQNASLDVDQNGTLTVGDVWAKIDNAVAAARARPLIVVDAEPEQTTKKDPPGAEETPLPALHSPASGSPGSSFGASSARSQGGGAVANSRDEQRELAVFAASVELAEVEANVWTTERLHAYWRDALGLAVDANVEGYLRADWCGVFVLWCLHQAKIALEQHWVVGLGFVGPAKLAQAKAPKPGDVAYRDKPYQHHAIVVAVDGDTVHTIDGNQGTTPIKTHAAPLSSWTAFYSIEPLLGGQA